MEAGQSGRDETVSAAGGAERTTVVDPYRHDTDSWTARESLGDLIPEGKYGAGLRGHRLVTGVERGETPQAVMPAKSGNDGRSRGLSDRAARTEIAW